MKTLPGALLALQLLVVPLSGLAQQGSDSVLDQPPVRPQEPVVMPEYPPDESTPKIVIRPGEDKVFYEYRVNGQLREIKVVPEVGPPYYLVPADGGGWIREEESTLLIPSWVIFRW